MFKEVCSRRGFLRNTASLASTVFLGSFLVPPGLAQAGEPSPAIPGKNNPRLEAFSGIGLNVDPEKIDFNPEFLKRIGTTWVRMVLKPKSNYRELIDNLGNNGIETVGVIEQESIKVDPEIVSPYDAEGLMSDPHLDVVANYYKEKYPNLKFLQVGNEPDGVGFASWSLEPDVYMRLLTSFRNVFPDRFLIGAGLSSGKPDYLKGLPLKGTIDALALHPYGVSLPDFKSETDFTTADSLVERYREMNLPILISEAGVDHTQYDEQTAALYIESLLRYFRDSSATLGVAYFCASDLMVMHHGLFDNEGNPRLSLGAFSRVALGENLSPAGDFRLFPVKSTPGI